MVYKDLEVEDTEWPVHIRESHEGRFMGPLSSNFFHNRILVWCNQMLANYYVDGLAMYFKSENTQILYDYYKFKSAILDREAKLSVERPNVATIIINKQELNKIRNKNNNDLANGKMIDANIHEKRQKNITKLVNIGHELNTMKAFGPRWLGWIGFKSDHLTMPKLNPFNVAFQYTILTFLLFRIVFSLIICVMTERKLVVSVERDAVSLSQAGCTKKTLINNTLNQSTFEQTTVTRSQLNNNYCTIKDQTVIDLFDEQFMGICLYEVRYNRIGPLMGFFFIELQEPIAFMLNEAERLYWVALIIFIMSGYVGRVLAGKRQFDIPQMLFLLEPKFIAFRVHHSLNYYLTTLRASYVNFWSTYKINSAHELTRLDFICPNCDKTSSNCNQLQLPCMTTHVMKQRQQQQQQQQSSLMTNIDDSSRFNQPHSRLTRDLEATNSSSFECKLTSNKKVNSPLQLSNSINNCVQHDQVIDCLALNIKNFETYLPEHRNEAWRLMLCRYHPIIYCVLFVFIAIIIHGTTFILIYVANRVPQQNRELQQILNSSSYNDLPEYAKQIILDTERDYLESDDINARLGCKSMNYSSTSLLLSTSSDKSPIDLSLSNNLPFNWQDKLAREFRLKFITYVHELMASTRLEYTSRVTNSTTRGSISEILKLDDPNKLNGNFIDQIIRSMYPQKSIDYRGVVFGSLTIFAIAVFFAGALTICAFSMVDLCFALTELTIKINVCTIILHHYRDFASNRLQISDRTNVNRDSWLRKRRKTMDHEFNNGSYHDSYEFELDNELITATATAAVSTTTTTSTTSTTTANYPVDDPPRQDSFEDKLFNIRIEDLKQYPSSNRRQRQIICQKYADRILALDRSSVTSARASSSKFLVSTYLDYRLFQHEIELSRPIIIYMTFHLFFNSINFVLTFLIGADSQTKYMILLVSVIINNSCIFIPAWFASQCLTLNGIIYSMLAASVKGDKLSRFLMMIWKKTLNELSGSRSKFSFKILSLNVSYAAAIQLDLTIASILIITMDH